MGKQKFGEDEYLEFAKYQGHPPLKNIPRFSTFTYQDHFFFTLLHKGKAFMMSEGYANEKTRDIGMASVLKNCDIPERWSIVEDGSDSILVLKAGNHKEIARSNTFNSRAAAESMNRDFLNNKEVPPLKKNEEEDDYLPTKFYEGHQVDDKKNNVAMFKHSDGQFYFVVYHNDRSVKIRSEGFENSASRDKELSAVIKCHNNPDSYQVIRKDRYHMMVLKDEKGNEIGRSPLQVDQAGVAKDSYVDTSGTSENIGTETATTGAMATGVGLSRVGGSQSENKSARNDEYLPLKEFANRGKEANHNNFTIFTYKGAYYFALHSESGDVKLRSQAYRSEKARDNGMKSVLKNMSYEKQWSVIEENGKFYSILKAKNHQEIGRSGWYKNKAAASWMPLVAGSAAVMGLSSTSKEEEKRKNQVPIKNEKIAEVNEDDYLVCSAYENHPVKDKVNNVALFKHSNGQYYFALYGNDGKVKLRSEGFESANKRDEELSGVLKFKDDRTMYSREEPRKGFFYNVLKDKTGREVGRSCLQQVNKKVAATTMETKTSSTGIAAATSAALVGDDKSTNHVSEVRTEKYVTAKRKTGIVRETVTYKEGAVRYAAPAAGDLNLAKFWWIPLLLLLIPLLVLAWGRFNPSTVISSTPPPPVIEQVVEQAVVPPTPPVKAVPPPVAPTPRCKCEDITHPIFKLSGGPASEVTTKLGVAPEYGDLHNLDSNGFFSKLNVLYRSKGTEKKFLDGIFKQMGYTNGFADASADLFTSVTVPRGVSGNLGTKADHQTVYRKLDPTSDRDLEAFRIKAKNTCDLHFMKTCGNHFFFKQCDSDS